jgi:haloacid dehalogenase superfamily, subfamily IA, variant 3 with third motif having DD or ED/haloacid dehalogenase superfamily, subfamily IA, variant 1 with third motif having Dx(3-4)D or Dx(3-4)E
MTDIKAVIFDYGGVLIDWNPYYLYRKVFTNDTEVARFLQEIHFNEWNYSFDQGYPMELGLSEMCRKYPERAEMIRLLDERWLETIGTTFDATIALVKEVKERGYAVYGLSNWSAEKFKLVRPRYPFFDLFDDMVISGEVKMAKPDPRIFRLLVERNGKTPQECIYIDDSEDNYRAASQVGLQAIHYQSSGQLRQELQKRGVL